MKRRIAPFFSRRATRERVRLSRLVHESGLFDADWYVRTYPEAARARGDPLIYFLETGWRRGHDPNPEFSVSRYLHDNADVARAGMNPLLHFIEFGLFEGRDAGGPEPAVRTPDPATFAFGEAAPVASFGSEQSRPPSWRRAAELIRTDPRAVSFEGQIVGLTEQAKLRQSIDDAFNMLRVLSGGEAESSTSAATIEPAAGQIIDAWYVNLSRLRTRWAFDRLPSVVRAYQVDPLDDEISLVGEGVIANSLDFVDLKLANPLFPVLFLVSEPQGTISGWSFLAFPSLCRGGLHHCELLASEGDVRSESSRLAARLLEIRKANPAVTSIEVDIEHSDASGPLFQRYCQSWLQKVMRVEVVAAPGAAQDGGTAYLREEVAVMPARPRSGEIATLDIGSDMLPTIAVLTEPASREATGDVDQVALPLLVSYGSSSSQVILLQPPECAPRYEDLFPDAVACDWPRMKSLHARDFGAAAAIRYVRHDLPSDAQWLVPVAERAPHEEASSITWLIEPSRWAGEHLSESVETLAVQLGSKSAHLAFVGPIEPWQWSLASIAFPGRAHRFATMVEAAAATATALVGHIGPNVILHDPRVTSFFSLMLRQEYVTTASCVILDLERRGRHWRLEIGDGGALGGMHSDNSRANYDAAIAALWRCAYAVAKPADDLWVGRSDRVKSWFQELPATSKDTWHLCTALFTASRIVRRRNDTAGSGLAVPEAAAGNVTAFKALVA